MDIDCYDADLVEQMKQFTYERLGETLERVGQAPKTLLLYRTAVPFRKVQSTRYIDDEGRSVKLEVLGDGQQFVAFHVHPDTGHPYKWKNKQSPHNTHRKELKSITREDAQALCDEFDRLASGRGWKKASKVTTPTRSNSGRELDLDDPFISDKDKVNLPPEEIRAKLQMIPDKIGRAHV